uniref:Uncharacterized protein n=1 Tax=Arundo donax TaxID=35708 RepID=A0A0A9FZ11_ARUDO
MRDVDQDTGRDLLPVHRRRGEDDEPRANPPAERPEPLGRGRGFQEFSFPMGLAPLHGGG